MKKLLISSVGVVLAFVMVGQAAADEFKVAPKRQRAAAPERAAPQRAAPQQQASNWSGGQAGGSNGVSSVNNSFAEPGSFICPFGTTFNSNCFETHFAFSGNKATYTVGPFLGYRWQFGTVVVGVEGDWSWKKGENSASQYSISTFNFTSFGTPVTYSRTDSFTGSVKQTWDASIRGRYGVLVTPWTLVYGTAGVAFGEITGTFSYTGTAFFCASPVGCPAASAAGTATSVANWTDTRVGGTGGVGVEQAIAGTGWKWRAEYRYTDFGTYTKNFPITTSCPAGSPCSSPSSNVSISLRESFHTVRVGLGFDF